MIETKLNGQTLDVVAENVKKLRELFPEIVVEDKIDFDRLQDVLGNYIERNDESYRFNWYGKSDAFRKSQTPSTGTLRPCVEESKNWDTTENLYIEGDNLEVLKILEKSYSGKIKMIYIDPPYNKDKDFIYPDKWSDPIKEYKKITGQVNDDGTMSDTEEETEGGRHTKWLNMMYPRLRKARNLLKEDGVLFISIDDDELVNLKRLCNDIFGEENFIGILSVENNPKGRKNSDYISVSSEYCMIYAKNRNKSYFVENIPKKASDMTEDENGNFVHNSGKRVLVGENSFNNPVINFNSDKNYSVYYNPSSEEVKLVKENYGVVDQVLLDSGYMKYYSYNGDKLVENTYTEKKFLELFEAKALNFSENKIYEKNFSDKIRIKSQLVNKEYEAIVNGKKTKYSMELTTTGAGTYLKNLFELDEVPFSAPKNVGFIKLLISLFEKEDFIVLDFFSGSATTADAVMQLNAEGYGNIKFIMVQFPENLDISLDTANNANAKKVIKTAIDYLDTKDKAHILTEVSKSRINLSGDKIKAEVQEKYDAFKQRQQSLLDDEAEPMNPEDLDIGFKVFKLDSSNLQRWDLDVGENFYELSVEEQNTFISEKLGMFVNNFTEGRTELDMVYEIMLKYGLPLTIPIETKKVFSKTLNEDVTLYNIGMGGLIVCLSDRLCEDVADEIVKLVEEAEPAAVRVVVKDFNFISDAGKTNFKETLRTGVESYFAKTDNKANNTNQFEFITI